MSRLNDIIKVVVIIGNTIFTILSVALAVGSILILSGNFSALNFDAAKSASIVVLILSAITLLCTLLGCCGAVNQVVRRGVCNGRRLLSLYQLLVLLIFIASVYVLFELKKQIQSTNMVIFDIHRYPEYDSFERQASIYFNSAYFQGTCSENPKDSWFIQWVDSYCPAQIGQNRCSRFFVVDINGMCYTKCQMSPWNSEYCCPSETDCKGGLLQACPYEQCRLEALQKVSEVLNIFQCLLICYNPRDDLERELLKAGVITERDIHSIQRLKNNGGISSSTNVRRESNVTTRNRARMARVSPV